MDIKNENLNHLDLIELDKDLSEEEKKEWNSIYSSYRAGSSLKGHIAGLDELNLGGKTISCLIVINYRVKVLIPESEIWYNESTRRPPHVLRSMAGAVIEYVITGVDRVGDCATASRRQALELRRKLLKRAVLQPNALTTARVLAVGRKKLLAEAYGHDFTLSQIDLSYGMIPDLRHEFRPGQECNAIIKDYNKETDTLTISIKETEPNPFTGADLRHPAGCRRASKITGKYGGGVFCRLDRNLDCLCTYSQYQCDEDFQIGNEIIVVITKYNYEKKLIYGKIVSKW